MRKPTICTLCAQLLLGSLIPIFLKLYGCLFYALKICILFGYNPQINFSHFFFFFTFFFFFFFFNLNLFFGHFDNESEWTVGTLCVQLLLQFYFDPFKTLQMS